MQISSSGAQAVPRGEAVVAWRRRQLLSAGFPPDLAGALAEESSFDLHALLQLVERGCPPALAARILAPADGEGGSR